MKKTIICYIATLTRGGAEKVMANLANYFAHNGHDVYLVTLEPQENLYPLDVRIRQVVMSEEGPVRWSPFPDDGINYLSKISYVIKNKAASENDQSKVPGGFARLSNAINRVTGLKSFINDTKADAILSFMGKTNLRAIMAAMGTNAKSYVSVRSAPELEYPGFVKAALARILFKKADGIVFQSEGAASFFPGAVRRKSRIIINPLDIHYLNEEAAPFERNEIVTCGRLAGIKNHKLLIEAFSLLKKKEGFKDYSLVIYGEGEERESLEELVKRLGLEDSVELPGDKKDLHKRINGASLFVLSSDFEGMPNAISEAFALKIPVVSTDVPSGGIRILIGDNERGLLVPAGDKEEMAKAMERLLTDREFSEKLTENAYEFAQNLHPDIIHREWEEFMFGNG